MIEDFPIFDKRIEPSTNQVIPDTTQIDHLKNIYTIPFTKAKVNELEKYFSEDELY
jgi:hypothetical protein